MKAENPLKSKQNAERKPFFSALAAGAACTGGTANTANTVRTANTANTAGTAKITNAVRTVRTARLALILAVMMAVLAPAESFAVVKSVAKPLETTSLLSSEAMKEKHNFVEVTAEGGQLHIVCETPIKAETFNINVRRVTPTSSKSQWLKRVTPEKKDGYYAFSTDVNVSSLSGDYVLLITMPGSSSSIVFYKNANFRVKNGKASLLKFNTIVSANKTIGNKGSKYKTSRFTDKYLSDISFVFKDPKTGKTAKVTKAKVNYFKKVADSVTKGAKSDYDKALKIYEYVAKNSYYDDVAFATKKNQYLDPYRNLYNMRNKKKSANSSGGKMATVCVGNAAIVVALARAEGIPARVVNGHHISMGTDRYYNWSNEKDISKVDHWWAEVYVDGRWIIVDPTPGNGNRWNSKTGKWSYTGVTNYIYFDPTPEQMATSHVTYNIFGKGL